MQLPQKINPITTRDLYDFAGLFFLVMAATAFLCLLLPSHQPIQREMGFAAASAGAWVGLWLSLVRFPPVALSVAWTMLVFVAKFGGVF